MDTVWAVGKWLLGGAFLKALLAVVFAAIMAALAALIVPLLPDAAGLRSLLHALPPGVLWMLDLLQFGYGLSACLGALSARFLIRRIPMIG